MDEEHQPVQASQLTCVKCEYNLTGITVGGQCPECGTPVEQSIIRAQAQQDAPSAKSCMVWGIVSLVVCQPIGPIALWYYHKTKREMETGLYAQSSMAMAKAGFWTGLISTILLGLWCVVMLFGWMQ